MAKRAAKQPELPVIVDSGGILYERKILSIQKRSCELVHTTLVRYDKALPSLSWSLPDPNDLNGLTTLLYTHEIYVDTDPV